MSHDLRTQFVNYLELNRYSKSTIKNYTLAVKGLAFFFNKSPDQLSNEHIQQYLLYLIRDRKLKWGAVNNIFCGIISFCRNILKWDETDFTIPRRPKGKKLPSILSEEEVIRLFEATNNLKQRVILKTVYSAGLRVGEVIRLKPEHIESDPSRMMIRVEQGKGKKDRYTVLSRNLLPELRAYWHKYRPGKWLFPGRDKNQHLGPTTVHNIFKNAKKKPA